MSFQISDLKTGFAGHLLIASPSLIGSPFSQTVVFLCVHSAEEGAMGIVINRKLDSPSSDNLLKQLGISPIPSHRNFSVCAGGPVESSHGLVLHSTDWHENSCIPVNDDVMLSASLDILRELSEGGGPEKAILALGHANWAPNQLEEELKNNLWLFSPNTEFNEEIIYGTDYTQKWRKALKTIHIDPRRFSYQSGHV